MVGPTGILAVLVVVGAAVEPPGFVMATDDGVLAAGFLQQDNPFVPEQPGVPGEILDTTEPQPFPPAPTPTDPAYDESPFQEEPVVDDWLSDQNGYDVGCGAQGCCPSPRFGWLRNLATDVWMDQGLTINTFSPRNRSNFPVTFNDRSNDYRMNQLYLALQKPVAKGRRWSVGGRVDLLYGTDSTFTVSRGLETHRNFSPKWNSQSYGLSMPQCYMEVYSPWGNGLSMKLGHFYTLLGYVAVPATENFFYSHSYAMQYGEPFTHTGLLGSTSVGWMNFRAGMTRGWNNWEDNNNEVGFLGGLDWTSCDGRTTVAMSIHTGREADDPPPLSDIRTTFSLVVQRQIGRRCQYAIQYDHGFENEGAPGNRDADWYGVNQYLFYTINPCWKAGMRFEWFRDEDGARIISGQAGDYFNLTAGLNYKPNPRVTVRPSLRWDWVDTPGARPFADFSRHNQIILDCDLVVRF